MYLRYCYGFIIFMRDMCARVRARNVFLRVRMCVVRHGINGYICAAPRTTGSVLCALAVSKRIPIPIRVCVDLCAYVCVCMCATV